jgi:histidinol-phosphate aminotransferase
VGRQIPLTDELRHDLPAMLAAINDRTKVVLVCTPNNPTGPSVHRDELVAFIDQVPPHVVVAIDEAYTEFVTDPRTADGWEIAAGRANVVVMRTFSKAYGLAGLRTGYLVGPEPLAEAVRKCALPFGVSQVAQAAAVASLEAEAELLDRVASIVVERGRVVDALVAQGWKVPEAQGNFVWLALGEQTLDFAAACDAAGVSVRPFAGDGARVSIGETEANDIFLSVASRFVA